MTGIELLDELKKELSVLFADYSLLNNQGVLQNVKVFTQYLPVPSSITLSNKGSDIKNYSEGDYEANFPCVLIRHELINDYEERRLELSRHDVRLLFGVYSDERECQAWRDIFNMMDKVRAEFYVNRYLLNHKFRLLMPVSSKLLEVDTWPVYFGEMSLAFESGRAIQPPEFVHRRRASLTERS